MGQLAGQYIENTNPDCGEYSSEPEEVSFSTWRYCCSAQMGRSDGWALMTIAGQLIKQHVPEELTQIKCTAKLTKRADFRLSPPTKDSPDDWHANIFRLDRRFYVIFIQDRTSKSHAYKPIEMEIYTQGVSSQRNTQRRVMISNVSQPHVLVMS